MSDSVFPDVRALDRAYSAVSVRHVMDLAFAEAVARALFARLTRPQPDEGREVRHG